MRPGRPISRVVRILRQSVPHRELTNEASLGRVNGVRELKAPADDLPFAESYDANSQFSDIPIQLFQKLSAPPFPRRPAASALHVDLDNQRILRRGDQLR